MDDRGSLGMFVGICIAAVMIVVVGVVTLFSMQIAAVFFDGLSHVTGPAGVTPDAIKLGPAFSLMGISIVSIPASILLALLLGNRVRSANGGTSPPQKPPFN